jgi:ATP-dependent Lon protease
VPCRKDTAMTGEISLQGFVLPVGGIKEKCLAAVRNKIKRVILPYQNKNDAEELPPDTKNKLEIIFARNIREVILNAFERNIFEDVNMGIHDIQASPKF